MTDISDIVDYIVNIIEEEAEPLDISFKDLMERIRNEMDARLLFDDNHS